MEYILFVWSVLKLMFPHEAQITSSCKLLCPCASVQLHIFSVISFRGSSSEFSMRLNSEMKK